MCLGLNFERNLCNDGALQFCKGPIKYHLVGGSGPMSSWLAMGLICIEVCHPSPLKYMLCDAVLV